METKIFSKVKRFMAVLFSVLMVASVLAIPAEAVTIDSEINTASDVAFKDVDREYAHSTTIPNNQTSAGSDMNTAVNMILDVYGSVSQSYLYKESDKYCMVFHDADKVHIDIYDSNFKRVSTKTIEDELPKFGGFYSGSRYNFIVYGKSYGGESNKETYRIVKFDKEFNRLGSLSYNGDDTYTKIPFDACNSSFAENDGVLIYYTGRERLDGHQSNIMLKINIEEMTVADNYAGATSFPVNHASHQYRGIVKTDTNGYEVYSNLTDGIPCYGVSLFALNDQGGLVQQKNVVYTEMEGKEYNILGILNIVYGEVNGLSITDTSYILTGVYNDNVFASAVNKQSGEVNNTFITNYSEYSECVVAQESKMVQIDRNTNIVLWQTIVDGIPSVKYVKVDKNGNIEGKIKTAFNALLSDCQPIYDNDAIYWYTIKDGVNTLYTISDLKFSGNFEPLGSKFVDETDIWNGTADSSWYDDSKDSFPLTDPEQLAGLSELVNSGNDMSEKTFVLKNDIYLNSDRLIQRFVPIAKMSSKVEFAGTFDGNGHTIYGLYRREDDDSTEGGLFGTIGKYGVVKNLKIDQSYVRQDSGVFAAVNYGTIMFCENMGKITSATTEPTYTGGIVGKNLSMIYGCANKGRVVGYSGSAGGIAGFNSSIQGCIKCCYNSGEVKCGGFSVGGIAGYNISTATIEDCFNIGNVIGAAGSGSLSNYAKYAGGIAGETYDAYIVNCISTVSIEKIVEYLDTSEDSICGYLQSSFSDKKLTYDCYSLYDTPYGTNMTLDEMLSSKFIEKLNSVTDFYETRRNDIWVQGDFLPVTIAQKAEELDFYKFYPTPCFDPGKSVRETHFGYAETIYESSDERIVYVNDDRGISYGSGVGKASITVIIPETEVSAEERYNFEYEKYGISFDDDYKLITPNTKEKLSVTKYLKPEDSGTLYFESDDETIASISQDGMLTANKAGCTTITTKYGSYKATCRIYVTDGTSVVISGKCGDNLYYKLSSNGILKFTGSGEMTSAPWQEYNTLIKSIVFSRQMTNVFDNAFENCGSLVGVEIPDNIKEIGNYAFKKCGSLSNIFISDGVNKIGEYAFESAAISELTIPKSISVLGKGAFNNCVSLEKVMSYSNSDDIEHIPYTNSIKYFYGVAGASLINACRICGCQFVSLSNPNFVLSKEFNNTNELILEKYIGNQKSVLVPEEIDGMKVSTIGDNCFAGNVKIEYVTFSSNISSFEEAAFKSCSMLKEVILPENLEEIPNNMFSECKSLEKIIIPNDVTSIGSYAFKDCISLKKVDIPEGVKTIDEGLFYNCGSLKKINIPDSVEYFGKYAFSRCNSLKSLIIPADIQRFSLYAFINEDLTTIYGRSEALKKACKEKFIDAYYYDIPTQKSTLTSGNVSVTGYFPPDTSLECVEDDQSYRLNYINNGREVEPYGTVSVSIENNISGLYVIDVSSEKSLNAVHSSGKYTFDTEEKEFYFTSSYIETQDVVNIDPEKIILNQTSLDVEVSSSIKLNAFVSPDNATDKSVTWASSNTKVLTVSDDGEITAKAAGIATVTATTSNTITAYCTVTVTKAEVEADGIILDQESLTLNKGESVELDAAVTPDNATDVTVIWETSDSKIATVLNGKITAISVGTATITAKTSNGKTATCEVTVKDSAPNMDTPKADTSKDDTPNIPDYPTATYKFGDLDDDGKITSADSLLILRASVKLENFDKTKTTLADVDGDGNISSADALEVLRYSVKLPTTGKTGEMLE